MQKVVKFLEENRDGYLATMDGDQPRVRIFQFQYEEDGKLFYITSNEKAVWRQMRFNSKVEFCVMAKSMFPYLRITGRMGVSKDKEHIIKGFEMSPLVRAVFGRVDNPAMEAVYIEKGQAVLTTSPSGESEVFDF